MSDTPRCDTLQERQRTDSWSEDEHFREFRILARELERKEGYREPFYWRWPQTPLNHRVDP